MEIIQVISFNICKNRLQEKIDFLTPNMLSSAKAQRCAPVFLG